MDRNSVLESVAETITGSLSLVCCPRDYRWDQAGCADISFPALVILHRAVSMEGGLNRWSHSSHDRSRLVYSYVVHDRRRGKIFFGRKGALVFSQSDLRDMECRNYLQRAFFIGPIGKHRLRCRFRDDISFIRSLRCRPNG